MRDSATGKGGASGRNGRRDVRLSKLVSGARFIGCDDIVVRSCQDEAGRCRPGDVFVARATDHGDGHEAVPLAIARGAVAVVAERIISTEGIPLCLVPDADWAHARVCHALAGDPSREMRVIAVAGTSGKTTTAWLAAAVLAEAGHRVGVLSDLGCLGPDDTEPTAVDVISPAALARALAGLAGSGCSHAIVEVSSRMLAAQATAGMTTDTVVFTNRVAAHLDRHSTPRAYRNVLTRIMKTLADDGCLVTGLSAAARRPLLAVAPAQTTLIEAGLRPDCDVHARPLEGSLFGRTFLLESGGQTMPVSVETPTVPFVRDAVLAAAVGSRYGVTLEHAARGIEAAGSLPGRLERIDRGQDAAVFVDTPSSMHAVAASMASLRRLTRGRLAVIADASVARRLGGRSFAGRLGRWSDACLVVPTTVAADEPTQEDVAAYARVDRLLASLGRGDCVVVLGSRPRGHRPGDPGGGQASLAMLVDGWLQLAHPAEAPFAGRRAA
jgi:UDP-N-acetylmuramoyl-L-alanyl-D-glutamate--2,6-diaminopimelate ligase